MANPEVTGYVLEKFAGYASLPAAELAAGDLTMADVITRSPGMTNSLDLMEAFARTSNAVHKDYGIRVRLPARTLDTPVSEVLDDFLREFRQQQTEGAA